MNLPVLIISVVLFITPYLGVDVKEPDATKAQISLCTEGLDNNGMLVLGCLPDMGFTCIKIGADGKISFGASPTIPIEIL